MNNHRETAPPKRLDKWSRNGKFPKTTSGIAIANEIGIADMREQCPIFNHWIEPLEVLTENNSEIEVWTSGLSDTRCGSGGGLF
ncbi:MAG: DUF4276 family protein [Spartobacteria bacterium]|nr:DUF4276 family protein [Spartobacteria bacterium]